MCHWCHEVEIFEVNGAVVCTLGQDDTVEVEFDRDHVNSGCTTVSGEVDSFAADGEARAIRVIFLGVIVYTDAPICDILEPGKWDFIACNEHDSIDAFAYTGNTLGQAAEFSGIRFYPKFLVLWFDQKVPHLKSSPVSISRTALSFLTGNKQHAAFAGVRLQELM
jgi:hypothetical protein